METQTPERAYAEARSIGWRHEVAMWAAHEMVWYSRKGSERPARPVLFGRMNVLSTQRGLINTYWQDHR